MKKKQKIKQTIKEKIFLVKVKYSEYLNLTDTDIEDAISDQLCVEGVIAKEEKGVL